MKDLFLKVKAEMTDEEIFSAVQFVDKVMRILRDDSTKQESKKKVKRIIIE